MISTFCTYRRNNIDSDRNSLMRLHLYWQHCQGGPASNAGQVCTREISYFFFVIFTNYPIDLDSLEEATDSFCSFSGLLNSDKMASLLSPKDPLGTVPFKETEVPITWSKRNSVSW